MVRKYKYNKDVDRKEANNEEAIKIKGEKKGAKKKDVETEDSKTNNECVENKKQNKIMPNRSQNQMRLGSMNASMKPIRLALIMKECSKLKARKKYYEIRHVK